MYTKIVFFAFSVLLLFPIIHQVNGHALFNSAESTIGNNRVQIATSPEIPEVGKKSKILMHVTDLDLNDVKQFVVGIRIFYDDKQIDGIPPQSVDGGFWEFDYTFEKPGNHIFRVDLYDSDGKIITHTFNMSTQNPFGYIFFYVIMSGAVGAAVIFGYIYLPKRIKRSKT
ncbi:MAG: hypothetical protein ACT4OD_06595 [Candidatus Nitrosotenuis sp.]